MIVDASISAILLKMREFPCVAVRAMSRPPTLPPAPNPTLLLPPDLVHQLQVASYVFAGATAVLIWDVLHNLAADYHILFKHKFRISSVAYLVSRVSSLTYVLGFTLFATYPIGDCKAAIRIFDGFFPVSAGATSLLFFFRVWAVYDGRRSIALIFGFLWISVVGTAVLVPIGSDATTIGPSCIVTELHPYITASTICLAVHDTGVFFAISYRLLMNSHVEYTPGQRIKALFSGTTLHAFSKAVFRDGQKYYMITILTNLAMILIIYAPGVSPIYRGMMSIPNIALTSILACRVYRNTKLNYGKMQPMSLPMTNVSSSPRFTVPLNTDRPIDSETCFQDVQPVAGHLTPESEIVFVQPRKETG
ncbi:hypothetical protein B0H19DRAFT_1130024, partial [Mycena capillaripes]